MNSKVKVILIAILSVLLIAVCGTGIFFGVKGFMERRENEKLREDVISSTEAEETLPVETSETDKTSEPDETGNATETELVSEAETKPQIDYTSKISVDYDELLEKNSDYKGWLYIPDTDISYPVVMGSDNDVYLHRSFETGEYAYAGTLFIDAYSKYMVNQKNLIIYGHNMKNGSMFGTLKNLKDTDYFNSHRYIEFHTEDEVRVYEIFAVRDVSSDIDTLNYALDDFDVNEYIESAIKQSVQSREINYATNDDQIITLSTCVGDYTRRLLVSGIRIK